MGRPYAKELSELDATYAWASTAKVPGLDHGVARAAHLPLIAVGSGGSLTSANVMIQLHRKLTRALALTTTPLQLRATVPDDRRASVWLISAGGRNEDIRAAFRAAAEREPRQLAILCGAPESPLMRDGAAHSWVDRIASGLPADDGFLATNSALAFSVLIAASYLALVGGKLAHSELPALLASAHPEHLALEDRCAPLWQRPATIVLHGSSTAPAALDLESRFTEAALGLVQLADFRNFAHGRHHWLAKHAGTSGVLALVGPEDERLASATLSVLPPDVPAVAIRFSGALTDVLLASIVVTMRLAAAAGNARGIDPGRPGVPDFGRRLYHMKTPRPRSFLESEDGLSPAAATAIARKARSSVALLRARGAVDAWRKELAAAKARLADAKYGGLVCDYDGTLIETLERERPPQEEVVAELVRLLRGGVVLGIATGRGDSVTGALRSVLPKATWSSVIIGYHNGSKVQPLDQEPQLPSGGPTGALARAAEALTNEKLLQGIARVRAAADQITVSPSACTSEEDLWLLVAEALRRERLDDLRVVRSSHSVDVMPATSSKLHVVEAVRSTLSSSRAVLALGDRGCWPGNDYELLATAHALSVDEVSPDPATAWNLCPSGQRGVSGVLHYFGVMQAKGGTLSLSMAGDER
jgi:hydroxymethylpyrimidine pyrophosphatase-like HAD family hydrolase